MDADFNKSSSVFAVRLVAAFAALFVALFAFAAVAAEPDEFVGKWNGYNTEGAPYAISLMGDGTAEGDLEAGMTGLWQVRDEIVYLEWNSGWKAMIVENNDGSYTKLAFGPGKGFTSSPDGISPITRAD